MFTEIPPNNDLHPNSLNVLSTFTPNKRTVFFVHTKNRIKSKINDDKHSIATTITSHRQTTQRSRRTSERRGIYSGPSACPSCRSGKQQNGVQRCNGIRTGSTPDIVWHTKTTHPYTQRQGASDVVSIQHKKYMLYAPMVFANGFPFSVTRDRCCCGY